jgi:hypothetical protein
MQRYPQFFGVGKWILGGLGFQKNWDSAKSVRLLINFLDFSIFMVQKLEETFFQFLA